MTITIYTTASSKWYQQEADYVASVISTTLPCSFVVKRIKAPMNPITLVDSEKDTRFAWDWFTKQFPLETDGVAFHFTSYYKKKWRLTKNGSKNTLNKTYPEFWLCANKGEMAKGYENLSEFARLLFHEMGHFFEDLDDAFGDKLVQESVHVTDYQLKKIHLYHTLIDFRGFELKQKVSRLVRTIMQYVQKAL